MLYLKVIAKLLKWPAIVASYFTTTWFLTPLLQSWGLWDNAAHWSAWLTASIALFLAALPTTALSIIIGQTIYDEFSKARKERKLQGKVGKVRTLGHKCVYKKHSNGTLEYCACGKWKYFSSSDGFFLGKHKIGEDQYRCSRCNQSWGNIEKTHNRCIGERGPFFATVTLDYLEIELYPEYHGILKRLYCDFLLYLFEQDTWESIELFNKEIGQKKASDLVTELLYINEEKTLSGLVFSHYLDSKYTEKETYVQSTYKGSRFFLRSIGIPFGIPNYDTVIPFVVYQMLEFNTQYLIENQTSETPMLELEEVVAKATQNLTSRKQYIENLLGANYGTTLNSSV